MYVPPPHPPHIDITHTIVHRAGRRFYDSLSSYGQGMTGSLRYYAGVDSRRMLLFLAVAVLAGVVLRRILMHPSSVIAKFLNQALAGRTL